MADEGRRLKRRIALYGAAVAILGVLVYLGWVYVPHLGYSQDRAEVFALVADGQFDEARSLIDEMRERDPDDVRVLVLLGWLEDGAGDLAATQSAYEAAVPLCKNDEQRRDLLLTLADIDRRVGHLDEASSGLKDVVSRFGETARSRQLRVLLLIDKRSWDDALGEIAKLAEENPVNPHTQRLRSRVRRLQEAEATRDSKAVTDGETSRK
ncbi:MAG: hypothetical protein CMJ83_20970 [Planctomycetes bacterium]|nr:hypothetical protein [Planctomycetota bacterium]